MMGYPHRSNFASRVESAGIANTRALNTYTEDISVIIELATDEPRSRMSYGSRS
jgi:hypothetical protein